MYSRKSLDMVLQFRVSVVRGAHSFFCSVNFDMDYLDAWIFVVALQVCRRLRIVIDLAIYADLPIA